MKAIMKIPKEIQQKAIKKTVDGIVNIIIQAYEASNYEVDFETFVKSIPYMDAHEFLRLKTSNTELLSEEEDA